MKLFFRPLWRRWRGPKPCHRPLGAATRRRPPAFESLESRQLLSVTAVPSIGLAAPAALAAAPASMQIVGWQTTQSFGGITADQDRTSTNPHGESLAVADFNGDGFIDVEMNFGGPVSVYLGRADGSFEKPFRLPASPTPEVYFFNRADVNADGRVDYLTVGFGLDGASSSLSVFLGVEATGNWERVDLGDATGVTRFGVGDFNADGRTDLQTLRPATSERLVFIGNGDGSFLKPVEPLTAAGTRAQPTGSRVDVAALPDATATSEGSLAITPTIATPDVGAETADTALPAALQALGYDDETATIWVRFFSLFDLSDRADQAMLEGEAAATAVLGANEDFEFRLTLTPSESDGPGSFVLLIDFSKVAEDLSPPTSLPPATSPAAAPSEGSRPAVDETPTAPPPATPTGTRPEAVLADATPGQLVTGVAPPTAGREFDRGEVSVTALTLPTLHEFDAGGTGVFSLDIEESAPVTAPRGVSRESTRDSAETSTVQPPSAVPAQPRDEDETPVRHPAENRVRSLLVAEDAPEDAAPRRTLAEPGPIANPTPATDPDGTAEAVTPRHWVTELNTLLAGAVSFTALSAVDQATGDAEAPSAPTASDARLLVADLVQRSTESLTRLVQGFYFLLLGRVALLGEEQGWVQMLLAGQTEEQVLSAFLSTSEFYARASGEEGNGSADEKFLRAVFRLLLRRLPTEAELGGWLGALPVLGRGGVAGQILASAEYRRLQVEEFYYEYEGRVPSVDVIEAWVQSPFHLGFIRGQLRKDGV